MCIPLNKKKEMIMQLIKYANLSGLRIKKKAWMLEENYRTTLAFTDKDADTQPKKSALPPYIACMLTLGKNPAQEANGPPIGQRHNANT